MTAAVLQQTCNTVLYLLCALCLCILYLNCNHLQYPIPKGKKNYPDEISYMLLDVIAFTFHELYLITHHMVTYIFITK